MKTMVNRSIAAGALALPAVFAVPGVASAGSWGNTQCQKCEHGGSSSHYNYNYNWYRYNNKQTYTNRTSYKVNTDSNNGNYDGNVSGGSLLPVLNGTLDGNTVSVPVNVLSG
jgi:hypothetical protein